MGQNCPQSSLRGLHESKLPSFCHPTLLSLWNNLIFSLTQSSLQVLVISHRLLLKLDVLRTRCVGCFDRFKICKRKTWLGIGNREAGGINKHISKVWSQRSKDVTARAHPRLKADLANLNYFAFFNSNPFVWFQSQRQVWNTAQQRSLLPFKRGNFKEAHFLLPSCTMAESHRPIIIMSEKKKKQQRRTSE